LQGCDQLLPIRACLRQRLFDRAAPPCVRCGVLRRYFSSQKNRQPKDKQCAE